MNAVAIALLWSLAADAEHVSLLARIAIILAACTVVFLLTYGFLTTVHTFSTAPSGNGKPTKIIGGFTLTALASAILARHKSKTVQELFKEFVYDTDKVWKRSSRALAKLLFVVCYLGLTVCGSIALTCAAIILIVSASAHQAPHITSKKVIHIAILLNGDVHYTRDIMEGFRERTDQVLASSDYIAHYEHAIGFPAQTDADKNNEVMASLLANFPSQPDYLVTIGTGVSEYAYFKYLNKIPIIFIGVTDPIRSGLLHSLDPDPSRGNIAGVTYGVSDTVYLDFLSKAFPARTFGFIYNPTYHQDEFLKDRLIELAATRKPPVRIVPILVTEPRLSKQQVVQADIFFGRYQVSTNLQTLMESSSKPFVGSSIMHAEKGAIAALGLDDKELGAIAADRLLRANLLQRTALSDLPVLAAEKPRIIINLSAARRYNITISDAVQQSAYTLIP